MKRNRTSAHAFTGTGVSSLSTEENRLMHDIDELAQVQLQCGKGNEREGNVELEVEMKYVTRKWKARRRSGYRGVERTEVLGWESMARAYVL